MRRAQKLKLSGACALFFAVLLAALPARAQDSEVRPMIDAALEQIRGKGYDEALAALDVAEETCLKKKCSSMTHADVYMTMGVAYGLKGEEDKARKNFEYAIQTIA